MPPTLEPQPIPGLQTSLINKSLVVETLEAEEARYRMLETIRQYAGEKLEGSGEWEQTHDGYLDSCFAGLVEEIAPKLHQQDQQRWFDWLVREGRGQPAGGPRVGAPATPAWQGIDTPSN